MQETFYDADNKQLLLFSSVLFGFWVFLSDLYFGWWLCHEWLWNYLDYNVEQKSVFPRVH